jgi:two-component system response regulator LytT
MELEIIDQLSQVVKEWVPHSASIAISNESQYVLYRAGEYDIHILPGSPIPAGSVSSRVLMVSAKVETAVDSSVFGRPYYGLGYPIHTNDGFSGVLTVILPPDQPERQPLTFLMGHLDDMWKPIPIDRIAFFESYEKKTWLMTDSGTYALSYTLQALEQQLPRNQFVRIHRSYIVNLAYIDYITRDLHSNLIVALKGNVRRELTIGQSYVKYVRRILGF